VSVVCPGFTQTGLHPGFAALFHRKTVRDFRKTR
jgi:hypothetical protein